MEKKTDNELRKIYEAYPLPTLLYCMGGLLCFLVAVFNLVLIHSSHDSFLPIIGFIGVTFSSYSTVDFLRMGWNCFQFNKEAKRFFNEKGR